MTHIAVAKNRSGNFSANSGVVSHEAAQKWAMNQFHNNSSTSQVLICEVIETATPVQPSVTIEAYEPPVHMNGGEGTAVPIPDHRGTAGDF